MNTLGSFGLRRTLQIKQGATFGPVPVLLQDNTGAALPASACIFRGQIRKTVDSADVVATFDVTSVFSPTVTFRFGLTDEVTAAIPAGASVLDQASQYVWDFEAEMPDGTVFPIFHGPVVVLSQVTRG
jgi:hypothetical protein